jgi:hypothetical protein
MVAVGGGDTERLLHKAIRFVSIAVRLSIVLVLVATAAGVWGFAGASPAATEAVSALALHFSIGQKTPRDPAGTPGFAVGPSPHARFSLVPDIDGAGPDGLALLLR